MSRSFNGSSDFINLGNDTALLPDSTGMTPCAWIKPTLGAGMTILSRHTGSQSRGWRLGVTAGSKLRLSKVGNVDLDSTTSLTDGIWQFVAAVVSSTQTRLVCIAIDGSVTFSENVANALGFITTGNDGAYIGATRSSNTNSSFFNGLIANAAVFTGGSSAGAGLTDAELQAVSRGRLIARGKLRPAGFWPLFGETDPEPDFSVNDFAGTLTGTAKANHAPVGRLIPNRGLYIQRV